MELKELTPAQKRIVSDNHRFRVACCGRRVGKTTLAVLELVACAVAKKSRKVAYISTTYQQSRDIAWTQLLNIVRPHAKKINDSRLEVTIKTQDKGTSQILLKGWESIETLRGQAFDLLVVDEIASMKNWEYNWNEVLRPTLTDSQGQAIFISTPKGFNHFYDLYNKEAKDKDYKSFHFTSYDNPHLPSEEIDKAKQELSADAFAQEYMADFRKVAGLVCSWWDRDIHVQEAGELVEWYETIDGGFQDPLAYLLIGVGSGGGIYVKDGFRKPKLSKDDIKIMRDLILDKHGAVVEEGWIDCDDPRLEQDLNDLDINVKGVEKLKGESRSWDEELARTMEQYGRLEEGVSGIYIDPKLDWLIQEIETLMWTETTVGETLPKWDDHRRYGHHYDGLRALAYFLISFTREKGGIVRWPQVSFIEKMSEKDEGMYDPEQAFTKRNPFSP